jgi:hypothetical protein
MKMFVKMSLIMCCCFIQNVSSLKNEFMFYEIIEIGNFKSK